MIQKSLKIIGSFLFFHLFLYFTKKVVYNRIYKYLTNHNLLYNNKFGFRRNHSTYMALIQLVNNIISAMDNRESTAGVFLDLSKAFDTIDHHILLNKLDHYGIIGHSFNWASSYLANRKQLVQLTFSMFSTGTNCMWYCPWINFRTSFVYYLMTSLMQLIC